MREINLAEMLITKRREMGITQEELATHVGVGKAAVSKWENGNSFPDITHLPVIASFFGISIDQLVDYSPQLSKAEINKIYAELAASFASESFEDTFDKCRSLVKHHYSCYQFLLQISILYINHVQMAPTAELKNLVLKSAIALCERVQNFSQKADLVRDAALHQAMCHIISGEPEKVLEILGDGADIPELYGTLISHAHQMLGDTEKAKEVVQIELFQVLMIAFEGLLLYINLNITDFETAYCAFERAESMAKIFNMTWINPNITASMYVVGSQIYVTAGKSHEAIEMLRKYVDICINEFFPFKPRGDAFFDKITGWLDENSSNMPRDEETIKRSMLSDVMLSPIFESLHDMPEFCELTNKLENFIGGKENV